MPDDVHVDPDGIDHTSAKVHDKWQNLNDNLTTLKSWMTDLDGCWGDDEAGQKFSEGYSKNATDTRDGIGYIVDGIKGWTEGVKEAGGQLVGLDDTTAQDVDHQMVDILNEPPPG